MLLWGESDFSQIVHFLCRVCFARLPFSSWFERLTSRPFP